MGQRSQIYVKYNDTVIIANYYGWNYSERMISRARYGIEHIDYFLKEGYNFVFEDKVFIQKISRVFDVNFDLQDVAISGNIMDEYFSDGWNKDYDLPTFAFDMQDNNNGKLFVDIQTTIAVDDISGEKFQKNYKVKYALTDAEMSKIMSAEEYMDYDYGKNWQTPSEYLTQKEINTCKENISTINEMAEVMNKKDLQKFLDTNQFKCPDGSIVVSAKNKNISLDTLKEHIESLGWKVEDGFWFKDRDGWIISNTLPNNKLFSFSIIHNFSVEQALDKIKDAPTVYSSGAYGETKQEEIDMIKTLTESCNNLFNLYEYEIQQENSNEIDICDD